MADHTPRHRAVGIAVSVDDVTLVMIDADGGLAVEPMRIAPVSPSLLGLEIPKFLDAADGHDLPVGIGLIGENADAVDALNVLTGALNLLAIEAIAIEPAAACIESSGHDAPVEAPEPPAGHFMVAIQDESWVTHQRPEAERVAIGAGEIACSTAAVLGEFPQPATSAEAAAPIETAVLELDTPIAAPVPSAPDEAKVKAVAIAEAPPEPVAPVELVRHEPEPPQEPDVTPEPVQTPEPDQAAEPIQTAEPIEAAEPVEAAGPIEAAKRVAPGKPLDQAAHDQRLAELTRELELQRTQTTEAQHHNTRLKAHNEALVAAAATHASETAELRRIADTASISVTNASEVAQTNRRRVRQIQTDLATANEHINRLRNERKLAEDRTAELSTRNESLEASIDMTLDIQMQLFQLKAKVTHLTEHLDRERRKTKEARAKSVRLRQEINSLKAAPRRGHNARTTQAIQPQRSPERVFFDETEFYRAEIADRDLAISELTDKIVALRRREQGRLDQGRLDQGRLDQGHREHGHDERAS